MSEGEDARMRWLGKPCTFYDPYGRPHNALITAVHSILDDESGEPWNVNCVWVADDPAKHDPYGQQIERQTSVPHRVKSGAGGMFFEIAG